MWTKLQGVKSWVALAIQVPTRLWLGGVWSVQRNATLIQNLLGQVKAAAQRVPLLLCSDGFAAYPKEIRRTFREPQRTGKPGRPAQKRGQSPRQEYLAPAAV